MPNPTAPLRTTRTVAGHSLRFVWHGGPYIDIGFASRPGTAFDVINVWTMSESRIPFTREAFEAEVDEYVNDPERSHASDLANFAADQIKAAGVTANDPEIRWW